MPSEKCLLFIKKAVCVKFFFKTRTFLSASGQKSNHVFFWTEKKNPKKEKSTRPMPEVDFWFKFRGINLYVCTKRCDYARNLF